MKALILLALVYPVTDCGAVKGCPAQTAAVTLHCKQDVAKGLKTKEQCYAEIEASCP